MPDIPINFVFIIDDMLARELIKRTFDEEMQILHQSLVDIQLGIADEAEEDNSRINWFSERRATCVI